jgi:hypothetical protein
LVWEVSEKSYFSEVLAPDLDRWGVWAVSFLNPMTSRKNARANLVMILPQLKEKWLEWAGNK